MITLLRVFSPLIFICLQATALMADEKPDCPDNSCFDTQIISEEKNGDCSTYTLQVGQDGNCRYALSHFSIEVPCGQVTDISNSEGWAMEIGSTDPTTGITGIKIDDIKGFGEEKSPQSFTITYTICSNAACSQEDLQPSRVAYKAATCVHYQDLETPYTPMAGSIVATDASCPGVADGALDLQLSGGTAPYQFSWSNGYTGEDQQEVRAGTYSVSITDAAGEVINLETAVQEPESMELQLNAKSPNCPEGNEGSLQLHVNGGTAPYTYAWNNGENTKDLENLLAGTYTVTVTDANGCSANASTYIADPAPLSVNTLELVQPNCEGGLGSISVEALNGTAPYTYLWSNGESSSAISNLEPAEYTLTLTDAAGCSSTQNFSINAPSSPELNLAADNCENTLLATVSGGTAPYTYEWNTGHTGPSLQITEAGTYELSVTDANGCSNSQSINVAAPSETLSLEASTQNPGCQGDSNGSIDLTVSGGSGTYSYEWSNGETSEDLEDLPSGTYTVTVTDAEGCSQTTSFTISAPTSISIRTVEQTNINCQGEGGSLSVAARFGTAPYTYHWSNGESGSSISDLEAGYYTVVVVDANGCSSQRSFYITQDPAPAVSISSSGCGPEFELSAEVSGGSQPYTYEWNSGETSAGINAGEGTHTVTVTDANGCSNSASISLQEADSPLSLQASLTHVNCAGGSTGAASLQVMGGVAPYQYDWSNNQQGSVATNLKAGVYSVIVSDANGCSEVLAFTISEPLAISITAVVENNSSCLNPNGSIEVTTNGGTAPYTYEWNTGESTPALSGLAADNYTLTIEDAKGCVAIRSFTVEDAMAENPLTATLPSFGDSLICQGSSINLPVAFTGEGPYTLSYTDGLNEYTVHTDANPYQLELTPESNSSYSLLSLSNSCGEGTVSGEAGVLLTDCSTPDETDQGKDKNKDCAEGEGCFSTNIISSIEDGNCRTITLQVNHDGNCAYELSHFNIALACGVASNVSNSHGWPMEVNAYDPTTGIYGIKVDNIQGFGKEVPSESFTVTYTVCSNETSCLESLAESPEVAYKAGTCRYYGTAAETLQEQVATVNGKVKAGEPGFDMYPNPYSQGQEFSIRLHELSGTETVRLMISSISGVVVHQEQYKVSPNNGTIRLKFHHLPPGSYLVRLEIGGRMFTKQLYVL